MKRIALVDIYDGGHHLAFMRLFTKALVELGHEVWVFYPEINKIEPWIKENCDNQKQNIEYQKIFIKKIKTNSFGRFNDALDATNLWHQVGKIIKRTEKHTYKKVDLVFFAWIDTFLACNFPRIILNSVFRYCWSGLYFHPRHLKKNPDLLTKESRISSIDYIFKSYKCISIATHDQDIIRDFSEKRLNRKKVFFFPETADLTPPNEDYFLSQSIKKLAKGRIIVGLIGLSYQQGLNTMIELAKRANSSLFFFAFIGKLNIHSWEKKLEKEWNELETSNPENCLFYLESVNEGEDYNSIINSLDILFLVYNDFSSTSNRLTKAAAFNTLTLGSNRYCIGSDINKYLLGLTVEEGNVNQCINAIGELKNMLNSKSKKKLYEHFNTYSQKQSYRYLKGQFQKIISEI